jgi:hypothetical protein
MDYVPYSLGKKLIQMFELEVNRMSIVHVFDRVDTTGVRAGSNLSIRALSLLRLQSSARMAIKR